MIFEFNQYSTPLLFGFIQGWVYALIFWVRAWRRERLSDFLFGCLLAALSFEIWEYMLGFAGNNMLWTTYEFLPRNFNFLLGPLLFFYLKSQFNTDYRLRWHDMLHSLPFLIFVVYRVTVYVQGPQFVEYWKVTVHDNGINWIEVATSLVLFVVYWVKSYRLYRAYHQWVPSQFSNPDAVDFGWFRVFLLITISVQVFSWLMTMVDIWLNLDFWHDWWDELVTAGMIYYLGIAGLQQTQPHKIEFAEADTLLSDVATAAISTSRTDKVTDDELAGYQARLERMMREERPYLDPELSLPELARRLDTNASVLSAVINRVFGKNFNDYINEYRVEAVKNMLSGGSAGHLSLLGIAYECGFNSKSTFNRAFRKIAGVAPSAWS
jgi:AraC-like DNA-binding protein